ncbi:MAG: serine hydrolase, partial [Litorilinea sp.]
GDSNNYAANLLLAYLGDQDRRLGARRFTEFMHTLGYTSTYMQTGYDEQGAVAPLSTPANQQSAWDTHPDPNLQTTPREMGRFLADLFYCAQGEGPMLDYFAGELSAEKCRTVLFYMTHDEFQQMTWAGLPRPDNTWILHKHGFAVESHSDVALIWSHSGPYTLSIFLWRAGWMDWFTSNRTMKTISRITWNFFEFRAQTLGLDEVPHFTLAPPPGYQRIPANHIPVVARGD